MFLICKAAAVTADNAAMDEEDQEDDEEQHSASAPPSSKKGWLHRHSPHLWSQCFVHPHLEFSRSCNYFIDAYTVCTFAYNFALFALSLHFNVPL